MWSHSERTANQLLHCYFGKGDFKSHNICNNMEGFYCNEVMCRQALLMSYFDCTVGCIFGCNCCDICALKCRCNNCYCKPFAMH